MEHRMNKDVRWPSNHARVPKDIFHRDDVYEREQERVFAGPEWHPVAHRGEIAEKGSFKLSWIGEVPLLIVHGSDGQVRVFLNSCPHRGTQIETCSRGKAAEFECPYHRWSFSNSGPLLGAPGIDHFPKAFRKEDYGLRQVRSDELRGLIFATLDPAAPELETYLGETAAFISEALGDGRLVLSGYQKVFFDTNWKEYNDQEGYHAPLLHRAFRLLKWQGGIGERRVTKYGHVAVRAELQSAANTDFLHDPSLVEIRNAAEKPRSTVISLFPLGAILKHLDVITVRYAYPRGPHRVEVHYTYFHHADDSPEMACHRLRQSSNLLGPSGLISLEDGAVFNRVHKGSATPGYVGFQRGVEGPLEPPCTIGQNDESANPVKWERYRKIMEFERG
jgi:phenylpropionate dioxygenase-like ring-hydroxylating dioxygenase large terminal subunit